MSDNKEHLPPEEQFSNGDRVLYSHSPDGWRWFDTAGWVVKQTSPRRVTIQIGARRKSVSVRNLTLDRRPAK